MQMLTCEANSTADCNSSETEMAIYQVEIPVPAFNDYSFYVHNQAFAIQVAPTDIDNHGQAAFQHTLSTVCAMLLFNLGLACHAHGAATQGDCHLQRAGRFYSLCTDMVQTARQESVRFCTATRLVTLEQLALNNLAHISVHHSGSLQGNHAKPDWKRMRANLYIITRESLRPIHDRRGAILVSPDVLSELAINLFTGPGSASTAAMA